MNQYQQRPGPLADASLQGRIKQLEDVIFGPEVPEEPKEPDYIDPSYRLVDGNTAVVPANPSGLIDRIQQLQEEIRNLKGDS